MSAALAFGSAALLRPLVGRTCGGVRAGRSSHGTCGPAAAMWHKLSCKQLEVASALRGCGRKGGAPRPEYHSLAYCFHTNGLPMNRAVGMALCSLGDLAQVSVRQMEEGEDEDALQRERLDNMTEQLTASSALPFLLLMMPQIIKNAGNLMAGNKSPLSILPWMGYTTGLLGNMLLLTYFSEKKEMSATTVQVVGVVSTFLLLSQVYVAGYMPNWAFGSLCFVVALGLTLNYMNYMGALSHSFWHIWLEAIGVAGLMVLPQVVWSTIWSTISTSANGVSFVPGLVAGLGGCVFIILSRTRRLPESLRSLWSQLSGWTATLLFMFMPVAQLLSNLRNPGGMAGMSVLMVLLGLIGNALMIPRSIFTRDIIWFTGCTWATMMMGWGNLLCMYLFNIISRRLFWGITAALTAYLGFVLIAVVPYSGQKREKTD